MLITSSKVILIYNFLFYVYVIIFYWYFSVDVAVDSKMWLLQWALIYEPQQQASVLCFHTKKRTGREVIAPEESDRLYRQPNTKQKIKFWFLLFLFLKVLAKKENQKHLLWNEMIEMILQFKSKNLCLTFWKLWLDMSG